MDSGKTITRLDLTEAVYREVGFSHSECADLVDSVLEELSKALEKGESVKLSSFGSFKVRQKKQRVGRNPKTKVEVPITARRVVTFHSSNIMTKTINGPDEPGAGGTQS
jgi:integration host factor subunit alpha